MTRNSRRDVVRLAGATAATALVAGCGGPGDLVSDDEDVDDEDVEAWDGVDAVQLDAEEDHWTGIAPPPIEDEENPTLVLFEGREYEITWQNADGEWHNLGIRGDDEEWIESTESVEEIGETQTLEIDVTDETTEYLCEHHPDSMVGDVVIQS